MTALSEEEKKLINSIRELGLTPRADSPADLKKWMNDYQDEEEEDYSESEEVKTVKITTNCPKLSTFYGDVEKLTKGEVVYDQWHYEVVSLIEENHKEQYILQAIRRSVKGSAAKVLKRMKIGSSVIDILRKFESVYGAADSKATVLRNFYSAEQEETENVREWSCRLEELLDKATSHGLVQRDSANSMLCDKFWSGLKPELRDITGHKYDTVKDFDELRSEVKKIEQEYHRKEKKPAQSIVKSTVSTKKDDTMKTEMDELRGMIKQVATSVENIGEELQELSCTVNRQQVIRGYGGRGRRRGPYNNPPYNRGYSNDRRNTDQKQGRQYQGQDNKYEGATSGKQQQQQATGGDGATGQTYNYNRDESRYGWRDYYNQGPTCYNCGQRGHIQRYCRIRTDHLQRLN